MPFFYNFILKYDQLFAISQKTAAFSNSHLILRKKRCRCFIRFHEKQHIFFKKGLFPFLPFIAISLKIAPFSNSHYIIKKKKVAAFCLNFVKISTFLFLKSTKEAVFPTFSPLFRNFIKTAPFSNSHYNEEKRCCFCLRFYYKQHLFIQNINLRRFVSQICTTFSKLHKNITFFKFTLKYQEKKVLFFLRFYVKQHLFSYKLTKTGEQCKPMGPLGSFLESLFSPRW